MTIIKTTLTYAFLTLCYASTSAMHMPQETIEILMDEEDEAERAQEAFRTSPQLTYPDGRPISPILSVGSNQSANDTTIPHPVESNELSFDEEIMAQNLDADITQTFQFIETAIRLQTNIAHMHATYPNIPVHQNAGLGISYLQSLRDNVGVLWNRHISGEISITTFTQALNEISRESAHQEGLASADMYKIRLHLIKRFNYLAQSIDQTRFTLPALRNALQERTRTLTNWNTCREQYNQANAPSITLTHIHEALKRLHQEQEEILTILSLYGASGLPEETLNRIGTQAHRLIRATIHIARQITAAFPRNC